MLSIKYINIKNIDQDKYERFKRSVSKDRQMKASQYRFIDDAKRCICAELLLLYSWFQKTGSSAKIEYEYNEFGKPRIKGVDNFSYNLSHSGDWVVIAYSDSQAEIGVDIEKICIEEEDMPINMFTRVERAHINSAVGKERVNRFIEMWALKESYVKYIGTGLSTDLNSFSILIEDEIKISRRDGIQESVKFEHCLFQTNYYLATCSHEDEIEMSEIGLKELTEFIQERTSENHK